MRKSLLLFCFIAFLQIITVAQVPVSVPASKLLHEMQKLNVLGSVLYIAAHPDDENTRLITWLANEKKYRTAYLSLTRGDGGQNLIGDEQGIELGMIRTQELLAARRIDGGEQFFTRAYDFGYSKNPEETFRIWEKDSILADVVWVIRRFQPDVIITRFPTTGEGGHGHHTASAILANEAFVAAGDPTRFPEQLKFVSVWKPKRILWNTFNFGSTNTTAADQFKLDVGGYDALLGKSYGEIAAESRSQHKSQGFGVPSTRGESFEYFKTTGGLAPKNDLFEDIQTDWSRLQGTNGINDQIEGLIKSFDPQHPERSIEALMGLEKKIVGLSNGNWKQYQLDRLHQLILRCAGIYAEAITSQSSVAHGDTLRFALNVIARATDNCRIRSVSYGGRDSVLDVALLQNRTFSLPGSIYVRSDVPITQPYWLIDAMQAGRFSIRNQEQIGAPENSTAYAFQLSLKIGAENISLRVPLIHKFTDPVRGEVFKPLIIRPQVEIDAATELTFISGRSAKAPLGFRLLANQSLTTANVIAWSKNGNLDLGSVQAIDKGKVWTRTKETTVAPGNYTFQLGAIKDRAVTQSGRLMRIGYDHIPEIHYFRHTTQKVVSIDLKKSEKRIGYIEGAGDKVAEALERMGYEVISLGQKDLEKIDLAPFDAIITGVRAYNTHAWLNDSYEPLMKYVSDGGHLIVQYNTSNQIGPVRAKIGPYPFQITRTRVTDETASVRFLDPQHPVFNRPNKLDEQDFVGWVQERSIYHGADTSGRFIKLLSMSDPGEKSDDGSLLIASYGKGFFTYTGLALFRQLPAGVPGAYRLLANLIALTTKPGDE
ncbi:MAG: hypothetical protein RLZZ256_1087 [Bacteroidota bacterium]